MTLNIDEYGNVRINGKYIGYDVYHDEFTGLQKLTHKERLIFDRDVLCAFTPVFKEKIRKKYKVLLAKQLESVIRTDWKDKAELTKYYQQKLQQLVG